MYHFKIHSFHQLLGGSKFWLNPLLGTLKGSLPKLFINLCKLFKKEFLFILLTKTTQITLHLQEWTVQPAKSNMIEFTAQLVKYTMREPLAQLTKFNMYGNSNTIQLREKLNM